LFLSRAAFSGAMAAGGERAERMTRMGSFRGKTREKSPVATLVGISQHCMISTRPEFFAAKGMKFALNYSA
jgi:hypothetical protein